VELLGFLLFVHHDPQCSIVEVGHEDRFRTIHYDPQALEHYGKLRNPSSQTCLAC
jgi:hypothetical protein